MTAVAKDLHRLIRRVGKLTDGQVSVCELNWDDGQVDSFRIEIRPNSGYYKGGVFKFKIQVPSEYEDDEPPQVYCETDIYHPNIDTTEQEYDSAGSNVCLNLLDSGTWNRKFGLEGAVLGLVFLLHNPNLSDPLTPDIDGDEQAFEENVEKYMRGEEVDGREFDAEFLNDLKCQTTETTQEDSAVSNEGSATDTDNSNITKVDPTVTVVKGDSEAIENIANELKDAECTVIDLEQQDNQNESCTGVVDIENNVAETENKDNLLTELENLGLTDNNLVTDDASDGCTMVSFEDDVILVPNDAVGILQESYIEVETGEITEEQTVRQSLSAATETSEQANCDDTYSAVNSIVAELVENAMNKCPEVDGSEACISRTNLQGGACSESLLNTDASAFTVDNKNIGTDQAGTANTHAVVCDDVTLRKPWYSRQKSKESAMGRVHFFHTCAPYLKCIIFHTFQCLTKL